jgi:hypothetical protein
MSRLRRPHIPVSVQLAVALRQVRVECEPPPQTGRSGGEYLKALLWVLFQDEKHELHHRPAICNRPWDEKKQDYDPPANDPDYLVWLRKDDHGIETRVRGIGAQLSDLAVARKRKRRERKAMQPKRKWPSRPWPKSRKIRTG